MQYLPNSAGSNRDSNNPILAGLASPHVADHQRQAVGVLEFLNSRADGVLAAVDVLVGLFRDLYLAPERALQKAKIGAVVGTENRRAGDAGRRRERRNAIGRLPLRWEVFLV